MIRNFDKNEKFYRNVWWIRTRIGLKNRYFHNILNSLKILYSKKYYAYYIYLNIILNFIKFYLKAFCFEIKYFELKITKKIRQI